MSARGRHPKRGARDRRDRLERRVIELRFNEDLSRREIAAEIGISQMHVSRLPSRSLGELRDLVDDTLEPAVRAGRRPAVPEIFSPTGVRL